MSSSNVRAGMPLALTLGLLLLLTLATAFIGLGRLDALNTEFTQIVVDRHSKTVIVHDIVDELNAMARAVQGTLIVDGKDGLEQRLNRIDTAKGNLSDMLERLDKTFAHEQTEAKALQQAVHDHNSNYLVSLVKFTRLLGTGRKEDAKALLNSQLGPDLDKTFKAMQELVSHQTALMHYSQKEAAASYKRARNTTFGLTFVSVLLSILAAIWIARRVTVPLNHAVAVAGEVAAGNLTSRIEIKGSAETSKLLAALTTMNESLSRIVSEVRASSEAIASASGELLIGNNDLSQRTEEQASSLEETTSTVQQFGAAIKQNADNAKQASELAVKAASIAGRGEEAVGRVVETMGSINTSARRIVDIIGVIDALAFQTNILALNAAVESARAGEHGRGFAVVAAEVRSLAQRSAAAAKEIKELIGDSVSKIQDGAQRADEAGRTMTEILTSIRKVNDIMADISVASQQQSAGVAEVNQALLQMERITQQNAAMVEEAASAVTLLEEQARHLVDAVSVFRIDEAAATPPAPESAANAPAVPAEPAAAGPWPRRAHA